MDVVSAKVLAAFVSFFIAFLFGMLPYWYLKCCCQRRRGGGVIGMYHNVRKQMSIMQYLHSLASGVLISTCLIHLLPESLEAVRDAITSGKSQNKREFPLNMTLNNNNFTSMANVDEGEEDYPYGELLIAIGFLCVCMIDNIMKSCSKSRTHKIHETINDNNDAVFQNTSYTSSYHSSTVADTSSMESRESIEQRPMLKRSMLSKSGKSYKVIPQTEELEVDNILFSEESVEYCDHLDDSVHEAQDGYDGNTDTYIIQPSVVNARHDTSGQESSKSNYLRSAALVSSLCIHGFFDGVMLGLQTSLSTVMSLLFAISLHKSFVAIGFSLRLLKDSNVSTISILVSVSLFALATPVGILISGISLHETVALSSGNIVTGFLQSFAVGTFMYVALTETTDNQHPKTWISEVVNQVFLVIGFGIMAGLRAAVAD